MDKLIEHLCQYEVDQKREEEEARARPRKQFMADALAIGFTEAQAEFMWTHLAQAGHLHWDGMIG